eukprot:3436107-Pleurochrysis_carterae.AAC.1
MKKSALRKDKAPGVLDIGTIVQVAVSDVDHSRVDAVNVTLVVVEQVPADTCLPRACQQSPPPPTYLEAESVFLVLT